MMGLDMYLTAEKYLSLYGKPEDVTKIQTINELFGIQNSNDNYRAEKVIFSIAYWRKANAIHGWFVQNVQRGVDDCQKSFVNVKQLKELVKLCKRIQENNDLARELLPPVSGFFFGSTEIDAGYFKDLEDTVKQIERILNDPALEGMNICYQSSW